jgi:hypothetical protein
MILSFKTKINGKETFFVEKILKGLLDESEKSNNVVFTADVANKIYDAGEILAYNTADDMLAAV